MPSGRQVGDVPDRWVQLHNLVETHDGSLAGVGVFQPEELPAVVVFVVRDVQDRRAVEDDGPKRDDGTVARLIEGPVRVVAA